MQRMESEKNNSTMIYEPCCSQLADNHGHPNNRNCTRAAAVWAYCPLQTPESSVSTVVATLQSEMSAASSVTTPESLQAPLPTPWPGHCQLVTLTQKSRHTFSDSLKFSGLLMSFLMLHTLATAHILTACVFCPLCNCIRLLNTCKLQRIK